MIDSKTIDELATKLSSLVPESLKNAGDDLGKQFKQALQSGLAKMDLVTREEFDAQTKVLERTREKLEALEKKVSSLED
ncbi:accessory factor UbiK family protein [Kangiella sp. HZ709]|uniref:ubiquinone biosynthesis accessory factor UbiK n=1 Tax=Kangiella sp. HZ709 TaxID=2666328 RepID=UPI0012AEE6D8|nr:accessory factor UbiK family protein [Kangiella sp. HZ709]MRX27967.1 accessory factor UbiK family protein [Kangiella sp. HZ709]